MLKFNDLKINMKTKKFYQFLGQMLNVEPGEWGRLVVAWFARFFFQLGFTIGWTLLVALFISRLGVSYLPFFFLAHALLIILGSAGFAYFIGRIPPYRLAAFTTLFSTGLLLLAQPTLATGQNLLFFTLALFVEGSLCGQISILLNNFTERLFTPLEGERMFPLVESAETLGGVAAGVVAVVGVSYATPENLVYVWAGALFALGALLFFYHWWSESDLPKLIFEEEEAVQQSRLKQILTGGQHLRRYQFLKGLAVAILLQWFIFTLLDYQFTLAIEANAEHLQSNTHQSLASLMTHSLGTLHILFSLGGLVVQLFLTSRILLRLGIVRTLSTHPLVSIFSLGLITIFHNYSTVIFAKFQNEATGVLAKNAVHSSYYSFPAALREPVKEFTEGVMRPLGLLLASLILLVLHFFAHAHFTFLVDLTLLFSGIILFITVFWLRRPFTILAKKILEKPGEHPDKFDAVEILSQPGHHEPTEHLIRSLHFRHESSDLKIKILRTLGIIRNPATIPDILAALDDPDFEVRYQALLTLGDFREIGNFFYRQAFTRYRIVHVLESLLRQSDTTKKMRRAIIQVFANLHEVEVIPLLLDMLTDLDPEIRSDAIYVMGFFNDSSTGYFLEKYLQDPSSYIQANTIIALWQFKRYRLKLLIHLVKLLDSPQVTDQISGIYALGEIKAIQERPRLQKLLQHQNQRIQLHAAIALAKLGYAEVLGEILDFLLHENADLAQEARKMSKGLPSGTRTVLHKNLRKVVGNRIRQTLESSTQKTASQLPTATLEKLHSYYKLIEEEGEALRIRMTLQKK